MIHSVTPFENVNIFSSFLGRTNYVGFFVDWSIQSVAIIGCFFVVLASGISYVGIFLYIHGMVADVQKRLESIGDGVTTQTTGSSSVQMWSIYRQQIDFHLKIIGYFDEISSRLAFFDQCSS